MSNRSVGISIGGLVILGVFAWIILGDSIAPKDGDSSDFSAYHHEPAPVVNPTEIAPEPDESAADPSKPASTSKSVPALADEGSPVEHNEPPQIPTPQESGQPKPEGDHRVDETAPPEPQSQLAREQVMEGIEAFRPLVRECYEASLTDFPDASGRVVLGFEISAADGEGRVHLSELLDENTTLFDESLHDCMLESIADITFPVPEGGGTVRVTYPFNFLAAEE
ncbi:MAG: AgmX/PglI C-terminal domain-containing protein [Bradymonadaceae bacterium]